MAGSELLKNPGPLVGLEKVLLNGIKQNSRILLPNLISGLKNSTNNLFEGLFNQAGAVGQNNGKFFLPFKLNLKMHGLGGMKIFERFSVADDVLPSMYQNQTDFIITGLEHTIGRKYLGYKYNRKYNK